MVARVNVSIDMKQVERRLNRISQASDKVGNVTFSAARFARDYIIKYMPKSDAESESAKSIIAVQTLNKKNESVAIVTQFGMPHRDKNWNGEWFNLPLWMFTGNYSKVWGHDGRNGKIMIMRRVNDETYKKFRKDLDIVFDTAINK